MAIELMEDIKAAEQRAEQARQSALREGREMLKSVEEACLEHERQAQKQTRQLYQDAINETRLNVQKEIASHAEEKKATLDKMCAAAQKNVPKAAQLVFERIMSDGNR